MTNNESLIDYFKHVIHEEPLFNERAVFCVSLLNYSSALMNIQVLFEHLFAIMVILCVHCLHVCLLIYAFIQLLDLFRPFSDCILVFINLSVFSVHYLTF